MRKCCEFPSIIKKSLEMVVPESCGFRNINGLGYYSFGKESESQFGEFPWTMAVLKEIAVGERDIQMFLSGGSLIHPKFVLTAAHKINGTSPEDLTVRGGEWNTLTTDEIFKHEEQAVDEIIMHPDFNSINLHNDIALLSLLKPFSRAAHINPICMPQIDYKIPLKNCFATGWGKNRVRK
jgi:plasma kallikrein